MAAVVQGSDLQLDIHDANEPNILEPQHLPDTEALAEGFRGCLQVSYLCSTVCCLHPCGSLCLLICEGQCNLTWHISLMPTASDSFHLTVPFVQLPFASDLPVSISLMPALAQCPNVFHICTIYHCKMHPNPVQAAFVSWTRHGG